MVNIQDFLFLILQEINEIDRGLWLGSINF